MTTLTTRATKGSELTHGEMDANFKRDVDIKTTTYAALVTDNRTTLECNHATTPFTVTLGDAATMAAADTGDYEITIANIGAAAVTVARAGSDTIDGAATSIVLQQYSSVTLKVNAATNGYNSIARGLGGLTSTVAELNILDGVTSTAAELNILDGVTATAETINNRATAFRGAKVYNTTNQSITTATNTLLTFDSEEYDTSTIHDVSTNPGRLTVPAGVTKVRLSSYVYFDTNTTGFRQVTISKNGSVIVYDRRDATSNGADFISTSSHIITVSATDYFEINVYQTSGGNLLVVNGAANTAFSMEIIE